MRSDRPIFRTSAIQEYMQRREKDVLPRLLPSSIFMHFYILLCLLLLGGLLAFQAKVPISVHGPGTLHFEGNAPLTGGERAEVILFLPAMYGSRLHSGLEAQVEIGRYQLTGTIQRIETAILSRDEVCRHYTLPAAVLHTLPPRSIVVILSLKTAHLSHLSAGEPVRAQVQIGSRSIFSLLSGA